MSQYNIYTAMQAKRNREELQRAITESQAVERLPRASLQEICRIFRVEDPNNDPTVLARLLRNKVLDILCEEGPAFMDYLQLPKFRLLAPEHTQRMHALFQSAWERRQENCQQELTRQAEQQVERLLPIHTSAREQESFHLGLLQLYRDSPFCPISKPFPPEPLPSFLSPQLPSQPILYSFLNYPLPKLEQPEGPPYLMESKPLFDLSHYTLQPFFPQDPQEPTKTQLIKPSINIYQSKLEDLADRFNGYKFVQCRCEGEILEDHNSFECTHCHFWYHVDCLGLSANPVKTVCPLCLLRKESVFCRVEKEPVKFSWHARTYGNELNITMTEQQSQTIYSAYNRGLKSQIRFLKIDGQSLKKDRLEPTHLHNRSSKHTQITLPDPHNQNTPISLEIILRSPESQPNQFKLYFYGIFLIEVRKVDDIVERVFKSQHFTLLDYYQPWFAQDPRIVISLVEETFTHGHIHYPVRGLNCDHLEVFDLKGYLTMVNELKRDTDTELACPLCSKECTSFKYDQYLYNLIQSNPHYDEQRPAAVEITREGLHSWINDFVQPSPAQSSSSSSMGE